MSEIDLDSYSPMDPAVQQDPFPYYAALRERAPVFRHPKSGVFFVSRMEDVSKVLRHHDVFSSGFHSTGKLPPVPEVEHELEKIRSQGWEAVDTMLSADPPIQTRYRKAVGRAFSTRRILSFEPLVRRLTDELIDAWPERGRVDFVRELSIPLPVRVISEVLSIPREREKDVRRWSDDAVAGLGVKLTPERALAATRSIVEWQNFQAELLEERRAAPRDDFLSELLRTEFEDMAGTLRPLEMAEMLSIVQQLMVAGNEATTKGINEILKLLVQHPREWRRIAEEPEMIPAMVEEGLRLASPNQGLFRKATRDTELCGVSIPKGATLWVMFGSANRDGRVFPDPDHFDPTRENLSEAVAFGRGAHFCIGAPLARLELRVLFEQLARRLARIDFAPGLELRYEPSFILRGLERLEIDVEKRAA